MKILNNILESERNFEINSFTGRYNFSFVIYQNLIWKFLIIKNSKKYTSPTLNDIHGNFRQYQENI